MVRRDLDVCDTLIFSDVSVFCVVFAGKQSFLNFCMQ